jgi:hypothetical protein
MQILSRDSKTKKYLPWSLVSLGENRVIIVKQIHQVGTTEHMGIYGFLTAYGKNIRGFYYAKRRRTLLFSFI